MTPGRALGAMVTAALVVAGCASDSVGDGLLTGEDALLVAAASDLRPAFERLGEIFTAETGHEVVFDFGSSGQIAQRIIEGAPVDVYASANVDFVDAVLDEGRGDRATKATYAFGRITIWSRADRWRGWNTLEELVADSDVRFLAIANPVHAPYGQAARQAFESSGLWDEVEPRLVFGENISDTQRLADTGDADVAIVALSLAIAAGERGGWTLLDEGLHRPLEQALVVITDHERRVAAAHAFVELVNAPSGRQVMRAFGFVLPGER
jgi:molybdate transport system substrate-binding protein